jgi:hypothetical protein
VPFVTSIDFVTSLGKGGSCPEVGHIKSEIVNLSRILPNVNRIAMSQAESGTNFACRGAIHRALDWLSPNFEGRDESRPYRVNQRRGIMARKKKSKERITHEEIESGKRVSGEPDANLAAVGAGSIVGAAAGVAIGTATGGPVGAALGAAAGAVVGGATADRVQDEMDPKLEEVYWQENYKSRPYYTEGDPYENYLPAYQFGWESAVYKNYRDLPFEEVEPSLRNDWEKHHRNLGTWESVRETVRDSFERIRARVQR